MELWFTTFFTVLPSNERLPFFNKLQSSDENILSKDDSNISKMLLCGDHSFNDGKSTSVLTVSVEYIISTKYFDAPLYQNWGCILCKNTQLTSLVLHMLSVNGSSSFVVLLMLLVLLVPLVV